MRLEQLYVTVQQMPESVCSQKLKTDMKRRNLAKNYSNMTVNNCDRTLLFLWQLMRKKHSNLNLIFHFLL